MRTLSALLLSLALCGGLLSSCNRGSEVENELTSAGRLYLADGKPAVNARVRFYAIDHVPGDPSSTVEYETRTDSEGRYRADSTALARGEYNILGDLGEVNSYEDSVFIRPGDGARLPDDTLLAAGTVAGVVGLQPGDNPRTVTVQALGTNRFTNVDEDGRFTLSGLAQGTYTVRLVTTLAEYTPTFASLTARAGRRDSLADTLHLIYTGIPFVTGLAATYDTSRGVARIAWNQTRHAEFEDYLVYRSDTDALQPVETLIARTRDTVAWDTLYRPVPDPWGWPVTRASGRTEYRVRIRTKSGTLGNAHGAAHLDTPPPEAVKTTLTWRHDAGGDATLSIGDTLRLIAGYSNPGRESRRAEWRVGGRMVRESAVSGREGADTLPFVSATPGAFAVSVAVIDAGGEEWNTGLVVTVVAEPPVADAGRFAFARTGGVVRLAGKGTSRHDRVVKYEWDVGATGAFTEAPEGRREFPAPAQPGQLPCILRVTDGDGLVSSDTLTAYFNAMETKAELPVYPYPLSYGGSWDGRIFLLSLGTRIFTYGGVWKVVPFQVNNGGFDNGIIRYHVYSGIVEYDSDRDAWQGKPLGNGWGLKPVLIGNRFYTLGDNLREYFWETGKWEDRHVHPGFGNYGFEFNRVSTAGKLFLVGKRGRPVYSHVFMYDPALDVWNEMASLISRERSDFSILAQEGKIYSAHWGTVGEFQEYDVATDDWRNRAERPSHGVPVPMGGTGGKLYYLDGTEKAVQAYDPGADTWSVGAVYPGSMAALLAPEEGPVILQREGRFLAFQGGPGRIEVREYDPGADRWLELPGIHAPTTAFEAVVSGGKVYLLLKWVSRGMPEHPPVLFEYLMQ